MGERRNAHRILSGKHEGSNLLGDIDLDGRLCGRQSLSGHTSEKNNYMRIESEHPGCPAHSRVTVQATLSRPQNTQEIQKYTRICDYFNAYHYQRTSQTPAILCRTHVGMGVCARA
jgi:hypothetical protein